MCAIDLVPVFTVLAHHASQHRRSTEIMTTAAETKFAESKRMLGEVRSRLDQTQRVKGILEKRIGKERHDTEVCHAILCFGARDAQCCVAVLTRTLVVHADAAG